MLVTWLTLVNFSVSMLQKGQVFLTSNFLSPTLVFNSVASFIRWTSYFTNLGSVQLLSCVWLFLTPCTAACQAFLSITNSWSLLKLMSSSWWCHPTISSSVILFCLLSFLCIKTKYKSSSFSTYTLQWNIFPQTLPTVSELCLIDCDGFPHWVRYFSISPNGIEVYIF